MSSIALNRFVFTSALLVAGAACSHPTFANEMSDPEAEDGWVMLFDGHSLEGWRGYDEASIPPGWRIDDETLHFADGKGDIVTAEAYGDFELRLEWRVAEGGNSGIFYRAALGSDAIYMSAPEMQVLDDERHSNGTDPLTSAGAVYGLYPAPRGIVRPAGEWNAVRIIVRGSNVEHWLNEQKVVSYRLGSPDWQSRVAGTKFEDWPEYGQSDTGHIGLQDHGDPVWFRNIRIKVLD